MYGFKTEPVLITAFVGAVLFALVEFGVPLTDGQETAIQGVVAAILAFFVRSQVTSQATLERAAGPDATLKVETAAADPSKTLVLKTTGVALLLMFMPLLGCSSNPDPTTRPDAFVAQAAQYGAQAVGYVTEAQKIVNAYATAQGGRTPVTDKVSGAIRDQLIPQAERLRTAFNIYAAASTTVGKAAAIKDLQTQLDVYEQLVEDILERNMPEGLTTGLVQTINNIRVLIDAVRDAFEGRTSSRLPENRILVGQPVSAYTSISGSLIPIEKMVARDYIGSPIMVEVK